MTIFALKGSLEEITPAQLSEQTCSAVFITDSAHAEETLRTANITYEGVISLRDVVFCKIESHSLSVWQARFLSPSFLT